MGGHQPQPPVQIDPLRGEELVLMTPYQQAFNASARLIQAARELYDTLLGMV